MRKSRHRDPLASQADRLGPTGPHQELREAI